MKKTITIGIPAYNEEENIKALLSDVIQLDTGEFELEKIIVVSDGSTDSTVNEAKSVISGRIVIKDDGQRKGLAKRQNEIFSMCNSDVLIVLNADTRVKDKKFLLKMMLPIIQNRAEFVSCKTQEIAPGTFLEKVLFVSMQMKRSIFERMNEGNNIFTCYGIARAFSKTYYKKVRFPFSVGEDAYSYLIAKSKNLKYQYLSNTEVFYKLPEAFLDHEKQRARFLHSQKILMDIFGKDTVREEYKIPPRILLSELVRYFFKYPLQVFVYLVISTVVLAKHILMPHKNENYWQVSKTSKKLVLN